MLSEYGNENKSPNRNAIKDLKQAPATFANSQRIIDSFR